jgi:hypothetical protein
MNTSKNKEILENFNIAPFFRRALNLEDDATDGEIEKGVSYKLYIAESKRHECPKLKIMIGGEEISAMLDTGCELSILNEQLYNKLRLLGLNCLELPTQHLNLVSAFNGRSKRIRKQALLEIQIGDSTADQVILISPQLLTDAILGIDFLVDHAAELSFPDTMVSLMIYEKFCRLEFQGAREATRQEAAETSFKEQVRNFALRSTLPCTTVHLSTYLVNGLPIDKLGFCGREHCINTAGIRNVIPLACPVGSPGTQRPRYKLSEFNFNSMSIFRIAFTYP